MSKKMFEIISDNTNINFVRYFKFTLPISLIMMAVSVVGIVFYMNYGVDFRGGAEVQVKFQGEVELDRLRSSLSDAGFSSASVQNLGDITEHEYLIKLSGEEENLNQIADQVSQTLNSEFSSTGLEIRKIDIVGPKAGEALRISGFQAMLWALISIMVYVGLRFDFKFSPGCIIALVHDAVVVLGIFSFTQLEFSLQTVAAILAVIGYSVNDTVVVYDRLRENETLNPHMDLSQLMNKALNETLSRTILTAGTTLFISVTMFLYGGVAIKDFFLAISLGVIIGTYSTIFVASPITLFFDRVMATKQGKTVNTGAKV